MRRSALLALVLGCACTQPATQLVVVTDSDLAPADRGCFLLEARPLDSQEITASRTFEGDPIPFSFGVTPPRGDPTVNVEITVSAYATCDHASDPARAPVASRRVRTGFVRGAMLRLEVFLSQRCRAVMCPDEQTCDPESGACVDVELVDPESLERVERGQELSRDAGTRADASVPPFERPTAPRVVPAAMDDFAWDVATDASGDAFVATQTLGISNPQIRRVDGNATVRWQQGFSGLGSVRRLRRVGGALYVCGELEGNLTLGSFGTLTYPTTHGSGSALFVARLGAEDGTVAWASVISRGAPSSGSDTRMDCGGLAEIDGGLVVAFGATASASSIALDGVAVPAGITVGHATPASATGFVLVLGDDGARAVPRQLRAIAGVGAVITDFTPFRPRYQIDVVPDGAGGFVVTARGGAALSGLLNGESLSGSGTTLGAARYDANGAARWAQRFGLSANGATYVPRAVVQSSRVVLFGSAIPTSGSTSVIGLTGVEGAPFDRGGLFAVAFGLADGVVLPASYRATPHDGAITSAVRQPSGEIVLVGYAMGDSTAATATAVETFGARWSVADQDEGFVVALDDTTLDALWLLELETPAVAEGGMRGTTDWERVNGVGVGPGGETWITGKMRRAQPGNDVLGVPTTGVGYSARLR
jgi:hypothetical protein